MKTDRQGLDVASVPGSGIRRAALVTTPARSADSRTSISARASLARWSMKLRFTSLALAVLAVMLVGLPSTTASSRSAALMISPSNAQATERAATARTDDDADTRRANEVLDGLKARYRYLDGVTVTLGTTPRGEQAVAYYTEGRIIISRSHSVSIEKILAHEVWHVIDWRDNGQLDWREDLPPRNSSDYSSGSL